jgi:hypothetical protein
MANDQYFIRPDPRQVKGSSMNDRGASIIDRYVYAVRRLLPRAQRDDIAAELRAILQSQIDDEETAQRRPLSDDEVSEILRNYGHPRDVAAGYGARQHLIGPGVFPSYIASVKIVFAITALVGLFMILMTVLLTDEHLAEQVAKVLSTAVIIGIVNLGLVTFLFACASPSVQGSNSRKWNPKDLPQFHPDPSVRRSEAVGSLFSLMLMLCWWLGVNGVAWHWFGWNTLPIEWTAVWTDVHDAAIAVIIASMGREVMALGKPNWTKLYTGGGATLALLALLVLRRLVGAGTYVAITDSAASSGSTGALVLMLDRSIFVALIVAAIFAAASVVIQTVRFVRLSMFTPGPQH